MIKSFANKETENLYNLERSGKLTGNVQRSARRRLEILDAACVLDDLRISQDNRLEKHTCSQSGQYSIRINDKWRICFEWREGDAFNVGMIDYH